ncbi:hypothetical protein B0H13DRAFT_2314433 [Mycena leptocephala]|nr:hypothetical protein B0H13DRAFT_2314433 [Mycena leptocephala]
MAAARLIQSWSYLTASDTLDGFLGSASPLPSSFDPSHVQTDVLTSVRSVPPTESHTALLYQTPNSTPVSIDDELQHILNQLGPNELADSGTISNADQSDFNNISPFPSRLPSSTSDYSMFETRTGSWSNPHAGLGHYYSGPPSGGSEWEIDYQSNPSRPASASPFPGDFDRHDDFKAFQESTSAFAPPLASDLKQHENDFGTFPESTSNHSALYWDSDLVGTQ